MRKATMKPNEPSKDFVDDEVEGGDSPETSEDPITAMANAAKADVMREQMMAAVGAPTLPPTPAVKKDLTPPPPVKTYVVERDARVNMGGGLVTLRGGKLVTDQHFDIEEMKRQGVPLRAV